MSSPNPSDNWLMASPTGSSGFWGCMRVQIMSDTKTIAATSKIIRGDSTGLIRR
jgi:hypothetical protein